jgi:hypothetical protein
MNAQNSGNPDTSSDDFLMTNCSHCKAEIAQCYCDGGIGSPFGTDDELAKVQSDRYYVFEDYQGPDNLNKPIPAVIHRPARTSGLFTPRELELDVAQQEGREASYNWRSPARNPYRGVDEGKAVAWDAGNKQALSDW